MEVGFYPPHHWRSLSPITSWPGFIRLRRSGRLRRRLDIQLIGDPETEREFLLSRSPVTYADQIRTPLFVIQGANDPRVPRGESDQIVERLRARGVDVRYDVYEDEGHGFTRRENVLKEQRDTAEFFKHHLFPNE